jgi:hypothetical protein
MPRVAPGEALARFAQSGARLVSYRTRPFTDGVLIRVEMPDPESATWARAVIRGAGLAVGGNDTPWETQVVFTVPTWALDEMYPGWRQTSEMRAGPLGPARRSLGAGDV